MENSIEAFNSLDPVGSLSRFTSANTRPSDRPHHKVRTTSLLPSILSRNTYGSSLASIGSTKIITGITLEVGTPLPATPKGGEIEVFVFFSPLGGKQYNLGGRFMHSDYDTESMSSSALSYNDTQSIESYVKRIVTASNMIDLTQLCIQEGNAAWKIIVSCMVVNHDGNVIDTTLLGINTALMDLKLPSARMEKRNDFGGEATYSQPVARLIERNGLSGTNDDLKSLTFLKMPVSLTIGLFKGKLLVDPTLQEESLCEGMITIVVDAISLYKSKNQNDQEVLNGTILNFSKSGILVPSMEDISLCTQLAFGRAQEIKSILLPNE